MVCVAAVSFFAEVKAKDTVCPWLTVLSYAGLACVEHTHIVFRLSTS